MVKVDHISFSSWGGAGSVAATLTAAQRELGIDAVFHSLTDSDLRRKPLANPELTARAVIDKYLVTNREVPTLTSLYRRKTSKFDTSSLRAGAIPHFHWMEGLLTHERLAKLVESDGFGVWTLHDMAPLTGLCHYALECTGFRDNCERCPQAKKVFHSRVAVELSEKRFSLSKVRDRLKITAPSNWSAQKARQSAVFSDFDIRVIPNPVNPRFFSAISQKESREALGLRPNEFVATVVAADLNAPNKQVLSAAQIFLKALDATGVEGKLLLLGNGHKSFPLRDDRFIFAGKKSAYDMSLLLPSANLLISTSIVESAGLTVPEAAALGVPALALGGSAIDEMLIPKKTGYLAATIEEMSAQLIELVTAPQHLASLGAEAKLFSTATFHPASVAKQFQLLYGERENNA